MLGKFEELVLLALLRAGPKAPASEVFQVLVEHAGKERSFGATYTTLDRLVGKKFVTEEREANLEKAGRKRRYFTISGQGKAELSTSLGATQRLMCQPGSSEPIPGLVQ